MTLGEPPTNILSLIIRSLSAPPGLANLAEQFVIRSKTLLSPDRAPRWKPDAENNEPLSRRHSFRSANGETRAPLREAPSEVRQCRHSLCCLVGCTRYGPRTIGAPKIRLSDRRLSKAVRQRARLLLFAHAYPLRRGVNQINTIIRKTLRTVYMLELVRPTSFDVRLATGRRLDDGLQLHLNRQRSVRW